MKYKVGDFVVYRLHGQLIDCQVVYIDNADVQHKPYLVRSWVKPLHENDWCKAKFMIDSSHISKENYKFYLGHIPEDWVTWPDISLLSLQSTNKELNQLINELEDDIRL